MSRISSSPRDISRKATPSLIDATFVTWALVIPFALAYNALNGDGDGARHIVTGRHILNNGVHFNDVFSHTRPGAPFVAGEWGSQVVYALVHEAGGLALVLVFTTLLVAATYALTVRFLLRRGADPLLAYLAGTAAALLGSGHWLARPHLFTLLGLAVLINMLDRPLQSPFRIWPFAPLFALWANLHPGFMLGLAIVGAAALGAAAESILARGTERAVWRRRAHRLAAATALAAVATLATPHHVNLYMHSLSHLNNRFMMTVTDEFRPIEFNTVYGVVFACVAPLLAAALLVQRRRPRLDRLAMALLLLAGALGARRNVSLFGVAAMPLLVLEVNALWLRWRGRVITRVRTTFARGEAAARPGPVAAVFALLLLVLGLLHGRVGSAAVLPSTYDARAFPVEAVARARAAGLRGNIYNEMTWGGYILYAWPEQRVYIDGLTQFYGEALTRSYLEIQTGATGWYEQLAAHDVSIVIVPRTWPLAQALSRRGWHTWHSDGTAVILLSPDRGHQIASN
jgi:hypothetical protein